MKSIDKLRKTLKDCTKEAGIEPNKFDTYWITADACDHLIDEIEAEIERDYMPKPKIEKCFNAINSGITDISEALQNIAECNAAKCAMRQEVTHADVETMIGSIAAIADAYYTRLPVDADGVPIHVGDSVAEEPFRPNIGEKPAEVVCMLINSDGWSIGDCDPRGHWFHPATLEHVKPRTLEDVLIEYRLKAYNLYADQELTGEERVDEFIKLDAEYESEIRELLGGDAE